MLRIPLPEDDGFALAVQVGCFARKPCVKGQRDRRDEGTFACYSLIYRSFVYLGR